MKRELSRVVATMKTLVIFLLIHGLSAEEKMGQTLLIERWMENLVKSELSADYEDRSKNLDISRPPLGLDELTEKFKRIPDSEEMSRSQSAAPYLQLLCPCETTYEVRDLGEEHYPRYLTASKCKAKTCHGKFNSCRLLHYKVYVLTQRETKNASEESYADKNVILETPLPESLRQKWQFKPTSIGVACVPGN